MLLQIWLANNIELILQCRPLGLFSTPVHNSTPTSFQRQGATCQLIIRIIKTRRPSTRPTNPTVKGLCLHITIHTGLYLTKATRRVPLTGHHTTTRKPTNLQSDITHSILITIRVLDTTKQHPSRHLTLVTMCLVSLTNIRLYQMHLAGSGHLNRHLLLPLHRPQDGKMSILLELCGLSDHRLHLLPETSVQSATMSHHHRKLRRLERGALKV